MEPMMRQFLHIKVKFDERWINEPFFKQADECAEYILTLTGHRKRLAAINNSTDMKDLKALKEKLGTSKHCSCELCKLCEGILSRYEDVRTRLNDFAAGEYTKDSRRFGFDWRRVFNSIDKDLNNLKDGLVTAKKKTNNWNPRLHMR